MHDIRSASNVYDLVSSLLVFDCYQLRYLKVDGETADPTGLAETRKPANRMASGDAD